MALFIFCGEGGKTLSALRPLRVFPLRFFAVKTIPTKNNLHKFFNAKPPFIVHHSYLIVPISSLKVPTCFN